MKMKSISILKGEPLPYGVTVYEDRINCSIRLGSAKECHLKLYNKLTNVCICDILLEERFKTGSIFAVNISRILLERLLLKAEISLSDISYTYQVGDREFIDPYARVIYGRSEYGKLDKRDKLLGGFILEEFDWEEDKPLEIPLSKTIIYKVHVRGFTKHSSAMVVNNGTFLGIVEKISYLKELGITCLQLMPAYEYNEMLQLSGLNSQMKINYWGYSEDNYYFAPKASYGNNPNQVSKDFKTMVRALHKEGIEVIMEMNFVKGTNYILALDVLRHWVMEYHIDGFVVLAEESLAVMIAQDSILNRVKLLFPNWNLDSVGDNNDSKHLADYNIDYANNIKRFNRGEEEQVKHFSSNFIRNHEHKGVINYITNHDGFTIADLYSYDVKHNEINGEKNLDGCEYNYGWNCGREGKTESKKIIGLRLKLIRNAFTILLLSQGAPLILAGDEFLNSQEGNNNAYCQDNDITWLDWENLSVHREMFEFVKQLIILRKNHSVFHNEVPLKSMDYIYCGMPDVSFHSTKAWCVDYNHYSRVIGVLLSGRYAKINKTRDDNTFYLAFNMHDEKKGFYLPNTEKGEVWSVLIYTSTGEIHTDYSEKDILVNQRYYEVPARSIVVFISRKGTV
ncbi:MAG: alpha amylase catalytic region [Anaerocolumna sp.]|nr:alpha amylase catalytic region [Anaerocolumna sp.]